ncbi:alpha-amylase family glycosyl hydrolase [Mycoplasma sp. 480]|uniref:alpha-amylase family glycosyl hydrolase n=1 Tax=Mycoplasma sp. 480 TaxID=3440155 RepID=UPI003F512256
MKKKRKSLNLLWTIPTVTFFSSLAVSCKYGEESTEKTKIDNPKTSTEKEKRKETTDVPTVPVVEKETEKPVEKGKVENPKPKDKKEEKDKITTNPDDQKTKTDSEIQNSENPGKDKTPVDNQNEEEVIDKTPVWDEETPDLTGNRVNKYSIEEYLNSPERAKLSKIKTLRGWSNEKFLKDIKKSGALDNLTYKDESDSVQFIAPFDNSKPKSNTIYQLTVYSFADGNNDGIGDFIGLKDNIDYFVNLGIDTLYLSPIHPASSYHGYDVIDYTKVAPELGGLKAFEEFLKVAHSKGIRVVIDMVLNHTSYEHPWFQRALAGDEKYQQYYYFYNPENNPLANEGQDNIRQYFKNVYDKEHTENNPKASNKKWVSQFWSGMPDLNLTNENVLKEIDYIHKFWAAKGVDGFRYDAFEHYFNSNNPKKPRAHNSDMVRQLFERWRGVVQDEYKKANDSGVSRSSDKTFLFGEWWKDPAEPEIKGYWGGWEGTKPGLSSVIDGSKWKNQLNVSLNPNDEKNVIRSLTDSQNQKHEWLPFLDNHDVERWITTFKEQNHRTVTISPHRLDDDERSAYEYALTSLLSRGGHPILYDGNELLMQGGKKGGQTDTHIREAFNWKDLKKRVFFQDERDKDNFITTLSSPGEGKVEDIVANQNSAYNLVTKMNKARQRFASMREMDEKYVGDPNEILWIWHDNALRYDEMTVRKNEDGTYLLAIYSWGNRPQANTSLKNEFEIAETLISKNITTRVQDGTTFIEGTGNGKIGLFLVRRKP